MNPSTIIVGLIILGIVILAIRSIRKGKKEGKACGSCSGGCNCNSVHANCHHQE